MILLLHVVHGAHSPPSWSGDAMLHYLTADPGITVGIALASGIYAAGLMKVWRNAGTGRGISALRATAFSVGMIVLAAALISPLDGIADQLQSAHMVQHLLLIVVVPPLILMGEPIRGLVWGLPRGLRRKMPQVWRSRIAGSVMSALVTPSVAFAVHATALLFWHMPGPYDAAVHSDALHAMEHLSFLGTALLFWWVVLSRGPFRRMREAMRIPYVIGMSLVGAAIGAVLTFASSPLYEAYLDTAPAFGMSALEDQQLAGLIMWVPGGIAYLVAAAALFIVWMEGAARKTVDASLVRAAAGAR